MVFAVCYRRKSFKKLENCPVSMLLELAKKIEYQKNYSCLKFGPDSSRLLQDVFPGFLKFSLRFQNALLTSFFNRFHSDLGVGTSGEMLRNVGFFGIKLIHQFALILWLFKDLTNTSKIQGTHLGETLTNPTKLQTAVFFLNIQSF